MESITLITLYLGVLLLPGLSLVRVFKFQGSHFLLAFAISYTFFSITFIGSNYFSINANNFLFSQIFILAISTFFLSLNLLTREYTSTKKNHFELKPIILITTTSALYQIIAGSFNEIPADIYAHMERYQYALAQLSDNSLGYALTIKQLLMQRSGVFYYLMAGCALITGSSIEQVISTFDFTNRTLFLIAIYFFSLEIFKSHNQNKLIGYCTVIFTALHMGINVFSYVRYYSLAPTMLNMIIYMSAIILFLRTSSRTLTKQTFFNYVLLVLFVLAAASIHVQESVFILVIVVLISFLGAASKIQYFPIKNQPYTFQAITITTLSILIFIGLYTYSHLNLPRAPNSHWRLWEFGSGFGLIPDITTLNLKFQFSRVITLWGILIYSLFFLHIKRYRNNLFILAGMLSPIVTILNPFFVDLFLRYYNSTTLWRFCYLIPIHIVAADLLVLYISKFKDSNIFKKSLITTVCSLMVILLLPIYNTWNGIHYSRFPTLSKTDSNLSYTYYQDLLTFLNTIDEKQQILTDPMTGYMVSAMTHHSSKRKKFMRNWRYRNFSFNDYSNYPLNKYRGYMIIINKRQKHESRIGRLANHWSKNEWKNTINYYPDELISHLKLNQGLFIKNWESNGVTVYTINSRLPY